MPPHVFMLVAIGAGLIAGYRMAYRAMNPRTPRKEPEPDIASKEPRDLGSLEWDEASRAYRPRRH